MKKKFLLRATLLLGSILWLPGFAQTQTVSLTTNKAIGESVTLVVNPRAAVSVDWGDGQPVKCTKDTITGTLLAQTITLTGGKYWETLVCEDLELTQLNLSDATILKNLYCQNNALTALSFTACLGIEKLNCANNKLTTLSFSSRNANLKYLNCSNNQLTSLSISSLKNLESFICDGNQISSLNVGTASKLKTIWCTDNALKTLYLAGNKAIKSVACANNEIASLTLPTTCPELTEVWCENNAISKLNLTGSSLKVLVCTNNALSSITYPEGISSTNRLYSVLCGYNNLTFTNLVPRSYVADHFVYAPQSNLTLPVKSVNIDEVFDLSEYNNTPYLNRITTYTWYKYDGTPLVKGSKASGGDYQVSLGKTTFYTPQSGGTYCILTSTKYPDLSIRSSWLMVHDPSDPNAIGNAKADKALVYSYDGHALHIQAATATQVIIVSPSGIVEWKGTVDNAGATVPLRKGIYLINGKQIAL